MNGTGIKNLYNLAVGAEYVVLDGKAVPIYGLAGERRGNCFFPHYGRTGFMVHTRRETGPEAMRRTQAEKAARPVVQHCELTPGDWK